MQDGNDGSLRQRERKREPEREREPAKERKRERERKRGITKTRSKYMSTQRNAQPINDKEIRGIRPIRVSRRVKEEREKKGNTKHNTRVSIAKINIFQVAFKYTFTLVPIEVISVSFYRKGTPFYTINHS